MNISCSMITVKREGDYIHGTLESLSRSGFFDTHVALPLTLFVSAQDSDYLSQYRMQPDRYRIEPLTTAEAEEAALSTLTPQKKHGLNYLRALRNGLTDDHSQGVLILEDDLAFAQGWYAWLQRAVAGIRAQFGTRWVLTLCDFTNNALHNFRSGKTWSLASFREYCGAGSLAVLFTKEAASEFRGYLAERSLDRYELPTDLLLDKWTLERGVPYCATAPSLVQHMGMVSTGCGGDGRKSPSFIETLPSSKATQTVPKVFHQIWLGRKPIPAEYVAFQRAWKHHHPDWEFRLWTEDNLPQLRVGPLLSRCTNYANQSNLIRIELLHLFGGVYLDVDFECLKRLDPLLEGHTFFAAYQLDNPQEEGAVNNAFAGSLPGHPLLEALLKRFEKEFTPLIPANVLGPSFFTEEIRKRSDVMLFPRSMFYPYLWTEKHRRNETFPNAFAVHHWAGSWLEGEAG